MHICAPPDPYNLTGRGGRGRGRGRGGRGRGGRGRGGGGRRRRRKRGTEPAVPLELDLHFASKPVALLLKLVAVVELDHLLWSQIDISWNRVGVEGAKAIAGALQRYDVARRALANDTLLAR